MGSRSAWPFTLTKGIPLSHATRFISLAVASALAWTAAAAETAGGSSQTTVSSSPSHEKPPVAASPRKSTAWYDSLKGIPLGPGTLDIGVNIRTRYEFTDNFDVRRYGTEENDHLLLLRTRLSLDYHFGKPAHVYVEMQDARYCSSELKRSVFTGSNPFYDEADLRQAFFEWQRMGGTPLGFKAGRQSITYGDRRIFGPGEWGNVGRYWWDAARLYVHTDWVKVDLLYGRRIVSEPSSFNNEHYPFHMGALYAQFKQLTNGGFTVKPDVFYVGRYDTHGNLAGESGVGDEIRHTLGFRTDGRIGRGWDYYGTFAGQFGTYGQDDIAAFGVVAGAGYTFKTAWSPRLGAEFAYASGDHDPSDGKRGTFDNVYGAADAYYYGWMNVVCWKNLEDYQISFAVQPTRTLRLWVEYNCFRLASGRDGWYYGNGNSIRRDITGQAGRDLGHEINLLGQWKIHKTLGLLAGYGCFMPGKFVRNTPGSDDPAHWVFTQLTFNL
jgi:hypothetical protein